jgi:hypothetical protein
VAANETATSLTVTATSTADTTQSGTASVTVTGGGGPLAGISRRDMVQANSVPVTINGDSAYYYSTSSMNDMGVFIENRIVT